MTSVLMRRWPRRACHNRPYTSLYIPLSYACLLFLSCLEPASGEAPGRPTRDTPASAGPPCLNHDHPCSSSSFSDPSRTSSSSPESDVEEGYQSTRTSSENVGKNPEVEGNRRVDPDTMEDDHEDTKHKEEEDAFPEEERVLNCIFSSVPLIGGNWLAKMFRYSFSDDTLLEASHIFLDGGELVAKFIDLGRRSSAAKMINILSRCLEEEDDYHASESASGYSEADSEHQNDYSESISNTLETDGGPGASKNVPLRSKVKLSSSPLPHHRRKRRVARSAGYGDSLVGFNLLGLLVVAALITYLVYLLV